MNKMRYNNLHTIGLFSLLVILAFVFSMLAFLPSPASAAAGCDCADYGAGWYPAPFWGGCSDCTTNPLYPSENCEPCGQTYAYCDGCYWDTDWNHHLCAGSYCCECSGVGYQVAPFWGGCGDCTTNPVYPNYNIEPCGRAYAYCYGCWWNYNWDTHKCEGSYNPCYGVSCPDYCSGSTRYYGGYCSGGNCYYSSTDCGTNYVDNYYCSGGDAYATQHYRGCSGTSCYHWTENFLYDECPYGCLNGQCKYCGDGVCTASYETCGNCAADCGCSSGYVCSSGTCVLACSNACTSGTTQCISGGIRQTCADYNGDGCTEWGGNYQCPYACISGTCQGASGSYDTCYFIYPFTRDACYKYTNDGAWCGSSFTTGSCYETELCTCCNTNNLGNPYDVCGSGYKCCYDNYNGYCCPSSQICGDYTHKCCTEGASAASTAQCQICNANWYLSSGHCCTRGWQWSTSENKCIGGEAICTLQSICDGSSDPLCKLFSTPSWHYYGYLTYYAATAHYACCSNVAMYGTTQNYFVPITTYQI